MECGFIQHLVISLACDGRWLFEGFAFKIARTRKRLFT